MYGKGATGVMQQILTCIYLTVLLRRSQPHQDRSWRAEPLCTLDDLGVRRHDAAFGRGEFRGRQRRDGKWRSFHEARSH